MPSRGRIAGRADAAVAVAAVATDDRSCRDTVMMMSFSAPDERACAAHDSNVLCDATTCAARSGVRPACCSTCASTYGDHRRFRRVICVPPPPPSFGWGLCSRVVSSCRRVDVQMCVCVWPYDMRMLRGSPTSEHNPQHRCGCRFGQRYNRTVLHLTCQVFL